MSYHAIFYLSYIFISLVQFSAINDALRRAFHMPQVVSIVVSFIIAPIPIAGQILGMFGAVRVWKWSWLSAGLLFWGVFLIPFTAGCLIFLKDRTVTFEIKKRLLRYWPRTRKIILVCLLALVVFFAALNIITKHIEQTAANIQQAAIPQPVQSPAGDIPLAAQQSSKAGFLQEVLQAQMEDVAREAYKTYPFLDASSPNANRQAIEGVTAVRNGYMERGYSATEALKIAIKEVAPKYAVR